MRRLRYFLAVAEELNVSRAARRLYIAQPPLSRQIQALEAEMGVSLFNRCGRQLSLTVAGAAFAERARAVLDAAEGAVRDAQRVQRLACEALSVGYYEHAAYTLLPVVLARFRAEHPGIQVELKCYPTAALAGAIARGEIDLAFVRHAPGTRTGNGAALFSEPFVLAMRVDHALAGQARVALAQCAPYPLIGYTPEHAPDYDAMIAAACAAAGFTPQRPLCVGSVCAALALASAGAGIALVPASVQCMRLEGLVYRTLHPRNALQSCTRLAWNPGPRSAALHAFARTATALARVRFPERVPEPAPRERAAQVQPSLNPA